MTFLVGKIAVPIPRTLPLVTVFAFMLGSIGIAVWTRRPELPYVNVAFVGNSMMYYNDLPRLLEHIADGHMVHQDSCLHGSSSIPSMLVWGNGMYPKWKTGTARVGMSDRSQYDFGACTVPQLLYGYDADLADKVEGNTDDGIYADDDASLAVTAAYDDFASYYDGMNPCLKHANYYDYLVQKYATYGVPSWDYLVLNDNTRSPARYASRVEGLATLENYYLPIFQEMPGLNPIFVSTYAYWSPYRDMGGLVDVPTFTSLTYEGYLQYAQFLAQNLPASQKPRVAKVGWAFLLVWEENLELWSNLFHIDQVHSSPLGTYLQALVIYHTIYGEMAPRAIALRHDSSSMWEEARRFAPPSHRRGRFPTPDEARYLYNVATRICVYGLRPKSLTLYTNGAASDYVPDDTPYQLDDLF